MGNRKLSWETIDRQLLYCPVNGNFYWRVDQGYGPAGSQAGAPSKYDGKRGPTIRIGRQDRYVSTLRRLYLEGPRHVATISEKRK